VPRALFLNYFFLLLLLLLLLFKTTYIFLVSLSSPSFLILFLYDILGV